MSDNANSANIENNENKETEIHLLDYWNIIRLRLTVFISVFIFVIVSAGLYVLVKTPVYRAETKLLIEPSGGLKLTNVEGVYDPSSSIRDFQARQEYLTTQMELITADNLLAKVFTDFKFANMPEFRNSNNYLEKFRDMFDVSLMRKTFLVTVAFDWKDPVLAAKISRTLSDLYVKEYKKRAMGFSESGISNLQDQLSTIKEARQEALKILLDYKIQNKMIDLDDAHKLLLDRMVKLNESLIEAKVEEIRSRAALKSINESESIQEAVKNFPEIFENPTITAFKLQKLKAQAESLGLLSNYNDSHPKVKNQKVIVQEISKAVDEEIAISLSTVTVLHDRAVLLVKLLSQGLQELKEESFTLDAQTAEYKTLKDIYDSKDKMYKFVLNRINEINISKSSGDVDAAGNINIITPAKVPHKIHAPRKIRILAIAFVLGIMLAGGTCFGLDYIDTTVKYKEEVETCLQAPVLGFIPKLPSTDKETVALTNPKGTFAEAFRTIRTSLGLSILGRTMKTCAVTSTVPSEGKSITAFNLALSFAREDKKVLLMECDMRRPRLKHVIGEYCPDNIEKGISSVIVGLDKLEDITFNLPDLESLDIALCGHIPPNPSELLSSENFTKLLEEVQDKYDMVVLDAPPVLNVTDSVILAGAKIPIVFVSRVFYTDKKQVTIASEQIRNVQGAIIGGIINNVDAPSRGSYGYYYGGYYHKYEYK